MSNAYPDMPEDFAPFAEPSNHRELNLIAEENAAATPIEKVHKFPKFHPPSPERCYSPCGFCDFFASEMCSRCDYGSTLEFELHQFCVGGDLTQKEAVAFADNVRRKWERKEIQKAHPRTWRWHLFLMRVKQRARAIKFGYTSWCWRREAIKRSKTRRTI